MAKTQSILVVSPVYNEGAHIARTAAAVAAQSRRPDRWVIIDDGSEDETLDVAREWEQRLDFLEVAEARHRVGPARDNLALARPPRAFNAGIEIGGWREFDLIGKLDGDVELPPEWFAQLLARFESDPDLGVAAGRLIEPGPRGWRLIPVPETHVHGAVKLYRRRCLERIGGVQERLGWDTIDEVYARMGGFESRSFADLRARHHRPWGSADGRLRGRARHGRCSWILHQSLPWATLRALKLTRVWPWGLSGLAFLGGYAQAALSGVPRVDDPRFRRFVRRELRGRMTRPLRELAAPRPAPIDRGAA